MSALSDQVAEALTHVIEPTTGRDVIALGLTRGIEEDGAGGVRIHFQLPPELASEATQANLSSQTQSVIRAETSATEVDVRIEIVAQRQTNTLPGVKHVIAVGAGKGGVGKSTVSVALAVGLRRLGFSAGILDADVYGPSMPTLTGTDDARPEVDGDGRLVPPERDGLRVMSMGYLVPADQAVIWRGPMAQKYVKELLDRGAWGELDYLIVDLPPGTGDIPLTLAQSIPLTGAIVVCTPQDVALIDAVKALRMYQKLGVEPLGVIENMSFYCCPQCGHRAEIFGYGGAENAAKNLETPFLGRIPLNIDIRRYGDAGEPENYFTKTEDYVSEALDAVVRSFVAEVDRRSKQRTPLPQLNISG